MIELMSLIPQCRSLEPLHQMRLAALGQTEELAFQPQTISIHQPWSVLAHILRDGAPVLRSLAICFPTTEVPAKVVWLRLVEALSHSSSLETLKLIFSGKCRSAGSDDTSDATDQLAALPSLLRACGPQMRKVGLYCVPDPLRQQIDATMAAYPDLPGCHVRFKAVLGQPTTTDPLVS